MLKKVTKQIKGKKGASTVEFVGNMFLFVTLIVTGFELFMMGYRYMTVSNFANELARTISIQGGVNSSVPSGFQGGNGVFSNYKKSSDIVNDINSLANSIGQEPSDITVRIRYQQDGSGAFIERTINSGTISEVEYGDRFEVIVNYVFRMMYLDKLVSLPDSITVERRKMGVSEFEHDYES